MNKTKREFLQAVINGEVSTDEIVEYAKNEIEKLDKENEKRRERNAKKKEEYQPILDKILNEILVDGEEKLSSEVAEKMEISVQKSTALLKMLVNSGKVFQSEKKISGKTKKVYKLA